jgi:hypothetical protein
MRTLFRTFWLQPVLVLFFVLGACSQGVGFKKSSLSFRVVKYPENKSGLANKSSAVVAGGQAPAFSLSQDYCYVVAISSAGSPGFSLAPLTQSTSASCANHPKNLGKSFGLFNIGQSFEVELPRGFTYDIHLLGFKKSPLNPSVNDPVPASCVGVLEMRPGPLSATNPNESKADNFLNEVLIDPEVRLIAFNKFTSVPTTSSEPVVVDLLALADSNGVSLDCESSNSSASASVQVMAPSNTSPTIPVSITNPNAMITGTCSNVANVVATTAVATDLVANNSPVPCTNNQFSIGLVFSPGTGSRVVNLQGLSATGSPLTSLISVYYNINVSGSGSPGVLSMTSAPMINSLNQSTYQLIVDGCDPGANQVAVQYSSSMSGPFNDWPSPVGCSSASNLSITINASSFPEGSNNIFLRARQIDSTSAERLSPVLTRSKDTLPPSHSGTLTYGGTPWINMNSVIPLHNLSGTVSGDVAFFEVAIGTASTCITAGYNSVLDWTNVSGLSQTINHAVSLTLPTGVDHYLGIRPVDAAGNTGGVLCGTSPFKFDNSPPASPGSFDVTSGIDNFDYANFSWSAPTVSGAPLSYYRVRATSGSNGTGTEYMPWSPAGIGTFINQVPYASGTPPLGQQLFFQIEAVDEAGNYSVPSETTRIMWNGGTWNAVPNSNAPAARSRLGWTPYVPSLERALVFGGFDGVSALGDGKVYDFLNNAWLNIGGTAPGARYHHQYIYEQSSSKVWVVSGFNTAGTNLVTGNKVDLSASPAWQGALTGSVPGLEKGRNGFWLAGSPSYVGFFAGIVGGPALSTNWAATAGSNWDSPTTSFGGAGASPANNLIGHSVTRHQTNDLYVFGGQDTSAASYSGTLYRHTLNNNQFVNLNTGGSGSAPSPRKYHAAELINVGGQDKILIWGGLDDSNAFLDGGIFTISNGAWDPIPNAPLSGGDGRVNFAHHWTGTHFIVWGGEDFSGNAYSDGAVYNPASGVWTPMNLAGAPLARTEMVFTGTQTGTTTKLFVWGGDTGASGGNATLGDGFFYQPNLP